MAHWPLSAATAATKEGFSDDGDSVLCGILFHGQVLILGVFETLRQNWKLRERAVGQGRPGVLLSLMPAQQRVGGSFLRALRIVLDDGTLYFDSR